MINKNLFDQFITNTIPTQKGICAVIVTFFPDKHFGDRLRTIKEQVASVIIIDNASQGDSKEYLKIIENSSEINFIWNDINLGVATALNQGCRYALDHQYGWVITFDQDTLVEKDMVDAYIRIYSKINDPAIAIIGSNYINPDIKEFLYKSDLIWEERRDVITSGSLISLEAYQKAGGFRDDFFIDSVDEEFCLKCCHLGYRIIFLIQPYMRHSIGKIVIHHLLRLPSLKLMAFNHPSFRIYFITRNLMILFFEYLFIYPKWLLRKFYIYLLYLIAVVLFEKHKLKKLSLVLLAIRDGICLNKKDYYKVNHLRILSAKEP